MASDKAAKARDPQGTKGVFLATSGALVVALESVAAKNRRESAKAVLRRLSAFIKGIAKDGTWVTATPQAVAQRPTPAPVKNKPGRAPVRARVPANLMAQLSPGRASPKAKAPTGKKRGRPFGAKNKPKAIAATPAPEAAFPQVPLHQPAPETAPAPMAMADAD